jgi:hypothetical protein
MASKICCLDLSKSFIFWNSSLGHTFNIISDPKGLDSKTFLDEADGLSVEGNRLYHK